MVVLAMFLSTSAVTLALRIARTLHVAQFLKPQSHFASLELKVEALEAHGRVCGHARSCAINTPSHCTSWSAWQRH
jgi:hypothetical protein